MALALCACAQQVTPPLSVGGATASLADILTFQPGEYQLSTEIVGLDTEGTLFALPDFLKAMQSVNTSQSRRFCLSEDMLRQAREAMASGGRAAEICTMEPSPVDAGLSATQLWCRVPIGGKSHALMYGFIHQDSFDMTIKIPIPGAGRSGQPSNAGMHIGAHRIGECTEEPPAPHPSRIKIEEQDK
ncbi:MAG: DUF3617 family protein [Sphingopyxis sp.]